MNMPINVFIIESETPNSTTSVHHIWDEIKKLLQQAGSLGKYEFYDAPSKADLSAAARKFGTWTDSLSDNEPVILWISVHGVDPEPKVSGKDRKYVGTSGASAKCEKVEWENFFAPIKLAKNPKRIIVLMDVCWGASPTAPARLTTPAIHRPALLFGPARSANRTELDCASKYLVELMGKSGIPAVNDAKSLVDSLNLKFSAAPNGTAFYRVWWWENTKIHRYPQLRSFKPQK